VTSYARIALVWGEQAVQLGEQTAEAGTLPPNYPLPYITWDEWSDGIAHRRSLVLGGEETWKSAIRSAREPPLSACAS
jgi:hypothetical protein